MNKTSSNKKIFIALDTNDINKALALVEETKDFIVGIKIGLQFFLANGKKGVKELEKFSNLKIFLDLKLHDISNTVSQAIKNLSDLKIDFLTIHSQGSKEMCLAANKMVKESNPNINLLAVTVLTSMDDNDVKLISNFKTSEEQVKNLAMIAKNSGLSGVIASGRDIKMLRNLIGSEMKIFCPGIRLNNETHDQKKVVTYSEFLKESDENCFAVIGRPIYEGNPKENIKKILDSAR
tara:strand:- start:708 stop:1415 length:708 start_codon:yes stop_codon:yes gene_type:complete